MPESQNIEWKSKWKDEYLEWICGYANAQGGKIYIGCDDDGKIIGLPNLEPSSFAIFKEIFDYCQNGQKNNIRLQKSNIIFGGFML